MMKKFVSCLAAALLLFGLLAGQTLAAAQIDLAIDGVLVPAERTEENTISFYLEQRPQMRSNSVFVPVRGVSEILGTEVSWEEPKISIKYGETALELTLGSKTAYKDGQKMSLPAAPYERGGYTYVPVRFIAEAFDCDVEWQAENNLVNIQTRPWELNGQAVQSVVSQVRMIVEVYYHRLNSPFLAQKLYTSLWDNRGTEVAEPEHFGDLYNMDIANFYVSCVDYYFLTVDGKPAGALQVYQRCGQGYNQPLPDGYTEYLLRIDGRWYALPNGVFELFNAWGNLTAWEYFDYVDFLR